MPDDITPPADEPRPTGPALSESVGVAEPPSPSATSEPPAQAAPEAPETPEPPPAPAPDPTASLRAEIAAERAAREALEQRLAAPPPKPAEPPPAPRAPDPPAPFPARAAFDSPDAFDAAVQQWHATETTRVARETVRAEQERAATEAAAQRQRDAEEATTRQQRDANERIVNEWNARRAKAIEAKPDFAAVVENPAVQISPPMAAAIMQMEQGADVAYHLGKNPAEAARIAALPPLNAVFELGRLAASLAAPTAPKISRAPDPIRPVGGASPAVTPALADLDMDAYAARRREQLRSRPH